MHALLHRPRQFEEPRALAEVEDAAEMEAPRLDTGKLEFVGGAGEGVASPMAVFFISS